MNTVLSCIRKFRDGNVPAGYEQLRVFKEALNCLPENVEQVKLRSDTAGYQHDLLKYCASGENKRFGRIEFAIGCDVNSAFKTAVAQVPDAEWQPLYRNEKDVKIKTGTECNTFAKLLDLDDPVFYNSPILWCLLKMIFFVARFLKPNNIKSLSDRCRKTDSKSRNLASYSHAI